MKFSIAGKQDSLCKSCTQGQITKNSQDKTQTICHWGMRPYIVHPHITECSKYNRVGQMSQHEAEKIAWVLEIKGDKIGFRPPKKRIE